MEGTSEGLSVGSRSRHRVDLRRTTSRSTWDGLVASADHALMFHQWDWLDLQEKVLGVSFDRWLVHDEGRAVGVFPVARSSWSLTSPTLPFPFLGPLVPSGILQQSIQALRRRQLRHGPPLARFEVGPLLADQWRAPSIAAGCEVRQIDTVVIDLPRGSDDKVQAGYTRSHRRSLARATKAGVHVRRSAPGELTDALAGLLEEAYEGRGSTSPYPPETGRLTEEWLSTREDAVALTAVMDEEIVGVLVVLAGHPTALAWVGGCFRRYRDVSANVLLYHEGLLWAQDRGCSRVDLCASVDEGVLRFKLGFGGQEVPGLSANSVLLPARTRSMARAARGALRR